MKMMAIKDISTNQPYRFRSKDLCLQLRQSIQLQGMVDPIWVARDPKSDEKIVVSGHRRFDSAVDLGLKDVPVRELENNDDEKKIFLLAVLSNFNQSLTEMERHAAMLKALKDFKFSEESFVQEILPALGLEPHKRWIMETMRLAALDPQIFAAIQDDRLPFKGVGSLLKFPLADQLTFIDQVAKKVKLTSSDLQNVIDDFYDWMREQYLSLGEVIDSDSKLKDILSSENPDLRQKAGELTKYLVQKRNPRYSERNEKFQKVAKSLQKKVSGLKVEAPPFFEDEGMTLHLRLKNEKSFESVLQSLVDQRSSLSELFKIML